MTHTVQPQKVILIAPPDSLTQERPVKRVVNVSKAGIAEGYIPNTIQLGIANNQLRAIQKWKQEQMELYGVDIDGDSSK